MVDGRRGEHSVELVRRMREEMRKAKKDIEDGKERERKVSKRLEVVMVSRLVVIE